MINLHPIYTQIYFLGTVTGTNIKIHVDDQQEQETVRKPVDLDSTRESVFNLESEGFILIQYLVKTYM